MFLFVEGEKLELLAKIFTLEYFSGYEIILKFTTGYGVRPKFLTGYGIRLNFLAGYGIPTPIGGPSIIILDVCSQKYLIS